MLVVLQSVALLIQDPKQQLLNPKLSSGLILITTYVGGRLTAFCEACLVDQSTP